MIHPRVIHPRELLKKDTMAITKFNLKVAVQLGKVLGNMWFFYFCVVLDLAELPAVISAHSIIAWVTYIAQTVIQLVALPVLQVYQNIQNTQNDAKADADHQALTYLATIQDEQLEILKRLDPSNHDQD